MPRIENAHIAILATNGFEQSELMEPKKHLEAEGADVAVIAPETGKIDGWVDDDWGKQVEVDMPLSEAKVENFDALVLPGGQINPDLLRVNPDAVEFIRNFFDSGKTLAAICHAPWLLIEAGVVKGREMTSYKSIKTDLVNAGAKWVDREVVCEKALITSRSPGDLDAFSAKIVEEVEEGRHRRRAA